MTDQSPTPPNDRRRDLAGQIGWGVLFALAAAMLVFRMLNGGGSC